MNEPESQASTPPIEDLLADSRWIRRLALRLMGDENEADEIVQRTYLAALRSPPRTPRTRAWLSRVIRNLVRGSIRDRKRRRRREVAAARSIVAPPVESVPERQELRGTVVEAVLRLPEPYRSTVILRFFGDRSTAEIAERDGVPPNTVRVRVKRALARLRLDLDQQHDGDRRAWCLPLAALAEFPIEGSVGTAGVDPAAPASAIPIPDPDWSRSSMAIASVVMAFLVVPAALWYGWHQTGSRPTTETASSTPEPTSPSSRLEPRGGSEASSQTDTAAAGLPGDSRPSPSSSPALAPTSELFPVVVVDAETGAPIFDARVYLQAADMRSENLSRGRSAHQVLFRRSCHHLVGETDRAGRLWLPRRDLARHRLAVRKSGHVEWNEPERRRRLEGQEYRVSLARPPLSTVGVFLPDGRPGRNLPVRLLGTDAQERSLRTDANGQLTFSWEAENYQLEIATDDHAAIQTLLEAPGQDLHLVPGRVARGRVIDARGNPIAGCRIELTTPFWKAFPWLGATDSGGFFVTPSLPEAGRVHLRITHPDHARHDEVIDLPWPAEPVVELVDGAFVEGIVRGPAGEPVATGLVRAIPAESSFLSRDLVECSISDDGSFRLGPLPPERLVLAVEHPRFADAWIDLPALVPGATRQEVVSLSRGSIVSGRVVTVEGEPAPDVRLQLGWVCGDEIRGDEVETDAEGHFSFVGVPPVPPRPRATSEDVRWHELLRDRKVDDGALLLEVLRPHELLRADDERIPSFGLLGSRNTCEVFPGESAVELVVNFPPPIPSPLIRLVNPQGAPIRTVTNLLVVPRRDPEELAIGIFSGTSGNPLAARGLDVLQGSLVGVLSRRYCFAFTRVHGDSFPITVTLEPPADSPVRLRLVDGADRGLPAEVLLFCPEFPGVEPHAAICLGRTDEHGELAVSFLPRGRYRISGPRGPAPDGRWRPRLTVVEASRSVAIGTIEIGGADDPPWVLVMPER